MDLAYIYQKCERETKFTNTLHLVVAYTFNKQYIGKSDKIPWHIPEDIAHFKTLTTPQDKHSMTLNFSIVIMGRKTWESIPNIYKPLQNRVNIVLSNNTNYNTEQNNIYKDFNNNANTHTNTKKPIYIDRSGIKFTNWDNFFNDEYYKVESELYNRARAGFYEHIHCTYYIIGGEQIYNKAIESKLNLIIHATEIYTINKHPIIGDTFFPKIENTIISKVSQFYKSIKQYKTDNKDDVNNDNDNDNDNDNKDNIFIWYRFITYVREIEKKYKNIMNTIPSPIFISDETHYLTLMKTILETGQTNNDRTGVGTLSIFGAMLKYDLRDTFPISTTKRIFFRAIFEELMLYLSGKTDNNILTSKGIHVWDGNTSRDFLDKRGLSHYAIGDMGQTYGFNMRHYGANYDGCDKTYHDNYGYDQLENVINLIKNEPSSRRIIINLWDPSSIDNAALPSCLCQYQFNVNVGKKELNLIIYLRSSDYFLANNWNTCTGALFVHLLCNLDGINLTPGSLTVFIADAHIYKSHIEQVKQNLERTPYAYPKLLILTQQKKKNILDFKFEDLELLGYKSYPNIKADMAI